MKPKVWMLREFAPEFMAPLKEVAEVVSEDLALLPGADVMVYYRKIDAALMDKAGPNLKLIAQPGIGVDHIDIPAATERGILIVHTPDAPTESTAEHTVALLLAIAKRVVVGDMQLRGADLPRSAMVGTEVRDRVLGILGYGRIGRRVAEICALGLKMRVLVFDPYLTEVPPTPEGVEIVMDRDTVIREADFLTIHTPLTPETRHSVGEREMRMMKQGSYLINASRGPVIDEKALVRVLEEGHLAGAALDVFDPEPPEPDNPLLRMTNVVVTPHIASSTDRGLALMFGGVIEQILMVLRGERPPHLVNPEAWPGRLGQR